MHLKPFFDHKPNRRKGRNNSFLMAEFGAKLCSNPGCLQHDFLPFTCSACSRVFCLQHFAISAHACAEGEAYLASVRILWGAPRLFHSAALCAIQFFSIFSSIFLVLLLMSHTAAKSLAYVQDADGFERSFAPRYDRPSLATAVLRLRPTIRPSVCRRCSAEMKEETPPPPPTRARSRSMISGA